MRKNIKLRPFSVKPVRLPTQFARFNTNLKLEERQYADSSGCENSEAPLSVIRALTEAINENPQLLWDHWDPQDANLKSRISSLHNVEPSQVIVVAGAIEGIDCCAKIFTKDGTKTGLLCPDWPGFLHYAEQYRNNICTAFSKEFPFRFTAEQIVQFVNDNNIEYLMLANPTPVQGNLLSREEIVFILKSCSTTLFVIDEADTASPVLQSASLSCEFENVVFLGSMSKYYGLSGLRVGYVITPECYSRHFNNTVNPIGVSSLAILAANVVLDDLSYLDETDERIRCSIAIIQSAIENTEFQLAADEHCFAGFLYSEEVNPVALLELNGIKILDGKYFGIGENVMGGRINLANTITAEKIATVLSKSSLYTAALDNQSLALQS